MKSPRIKSLQSAIRNPQSLIVVLFIIMLAASWQRWTQPLMDHGREMHMPARILAGERLYVDVQFLYGPFAPNFNAFLYRLFGPHLSVLKVSGAICGLLILLMIYRLARALMGEWESFLVSGLVMVYCALKSTANYVQPYAYASLYGLVFALGSLILVIRYLQRRSDLNGEGDRIEDSEISVPAPKHSTGLAKHGRFQLAFAGVMAGLAVISKPEIALAALLSGVAATLLESVAQRKPLWRDAMVFLAPPVFITAAAYGLVLSYAPLKVMLEDNHVLFTNMPPQLVYFNRHISGLALWPTSLWFSLAGIGAFALWAGFSAITGALASRKRPDWRGAMKIGLIYTFCGALWREAAIRFFNVPDDVTPFASAIFVLPLTIGLAFWIYWRPSSAKNSTKSVNASERHGDENGPSPSRIRILIVVSVFSLVSILRAFLNITATGPYTPFFIPTLILVYLYLLFRTTPALFSDSASIRAAIRRAATVFIALLIVGMALNATRRFRRSNTFAISSPRGAFLTDPAFGKPMMEAIDYVRMRTRPGDYVLSLPAGTTINFLADRPYPLREEIVHPGFISGENELDAIERIKARRTPLILISNLLMPEFRDKTFGVDYNQKLMRWIEDNYHLAARFDSTGAPGSQHAKLGDKPFFILAYERNP